MSNDTEKRLKNARVNIGVFSGTTAAMSITGIVMWFTTGLSAGTYLAAALTGIFAAMTTASARRTEILGRGLPA